MNTQINTSQKPRFFSTVNLVMMALFAAILCVLAPISVPIGPVPISLTNLLIYVFCYILGWKKGTISYIVYLLIGLAGLPVFSGFEGGIGKLAGPTGGYLIGFIFMTVICGIVVEYFEKSTVPHRIIHFVGMVLATALVYTFGTVWFCFSTGTGAVAAMAICVLPFIPGDLIKMAVAVVVGPTLKSQLQKIGRV